MKQKVVVLDRGQANFRGPGGFEAKAKDLTLRGQGQGLQKLSSRPRTSSRPPPLLFRVLGLGLEGCILAATSDFCFYKNLYLQKSQIAHGPAHLHLALIIIKQTLRHVESILLAMRRVNSFLLIFLLWKHNQNEL